MMTMMKKILTLANSAIAGILATTTFLSTATIFALARCCARVLSAAKFAKSLDCKSISQRSARNRRSFAHAPTATRPCARVILTATSPKRAASSTIRQNTTSVRCVTPRQGRSRKDGKRTSLRVRDARTIRDRSTEEISRMISRIKKIKCLKNLECIRIQKKKFFLNVSESRKQKKCEVFFYKKIVHCFLFFPRTKINSSLKRFGRSFWKFFSRKNASKKCLKSFQKQNKKNNVFS